MQTHKKKSAAIALLASYLVLCGMIGKLSAQPAPDAAGVRKFYGKQLSETEKDVALGYELNIMVEEIYVVPRSDAISASGFLIQSRFGRKGNFELVVPRSEGGLAHFWRENDAPGLLWKGPTVFGENLGHVDAVSLIQSTFSEAGNGPGNFEVVARVGDHLVAFWHPDDGRGRGWLPAAAPQQ